MDNNLAVASFLDSVLANSEIGYAPDDCGALFVQFCRQQGYSDRFVADIGRCVARTHERYPSLAWLKKSVKEAGLFETGKALDPRRGVAYLHFLSIAGLVTLSFHDYFGTNQKSHEKLHRWMEPVRASLGIDELEQAVTDVSAAVENREINSGRQLGRAGRVGLYLVLRHRLGHIRDLRQEQWREFVLECRRWANRSEADRRRVQVASIRLMHNALFNMGILEEPYSREFGCVKSVEKSRDWLSAEGFGEFATDFLAYKEKGLEKQTLKAYRTSLERFYNYLAGKHGEPVELGRLERSDVAGYVTSLFRVQKEEGRSYSWVQARAYQIKVFLAFVVLYSSEYERRGLGVFKKAVIVDKDFRVPTVKRKPKSLDKEVRRAFAQTFKRVPSYRYVLTFQLMLNSGLALADALCLKDDCISYDEAADRHSFSVWRRKTKKRRVVKPMQATVQVVEKLKAINTQQIPTPHPDGSHAIFLLNDGGAPCTESWFAYWFNKHKEFAAGIRPDLGQEIGEVTPHQLRHTFATILRESGADIMLIKELMLHESVNTTFGYTKESDRLQVELIQKLERGEYICDEFPTLDRGYLNSEPGRKFIENLVKFENRFTYGRCTVDGFDNCKKAYRCLTCEYLCSTDDDLPEILSTISIQRARVESLDEDMAAAGKDKLAALKLERDKTVRRIALLLQKVHRIQAVRQEQREGLEVEGIEPDDGPVITFV